jgi:hypothetical protein
MTYYETLPTYCDAIFESFAPYNKLPAFWEGLEDEGYRNPYDGKPSQGVNAQAWDRGRNTRMHCERMVPEIGD